MNQRPFLRKIVYLAVLVALLVPLSLLSMPARQGVPGEAGSAGGVLAQLRDEYKLGQANLGQIDPTSETIKLATLGMRNIAATLLWKKAIDYKMKEDWTAFSATSEQIIKVQPNFPTVWSYQGWNLAYNISYEFDDYRDRYFWVMKGIRFLQDGIVYNESAPRLIQYLGWVISQKIGTADEKLQFRRLFREDADFHGTRPLDQRDNWLVGRLSYLDSVRVAEREKMLDRLNPIVFLSNAPKNRINYAVALEEEGVFEEKAGLAWTVAHRDWLDFGAREIYKSADTSIRLNDRDKVMSRIEELVTQLEQLPPAGRREQIYEEKLAKLSKAERAAFDRPVAERDTEQHGLAAAADQKLKVSHADLAERVDANQRAEAKRIVAQIADLEAMLSTIERSRETTNYPYWLSRCEMEMRPEALEARRLIHQADTAFRVDQDLIAAQKLYEQGFAKWDEISKQFPRMRSDELFGEDMAIFINRYRALLKSADIPFPDKFPLQDILDSHRDR
ncbi:MAG TPA: hypothetical protein VGG64_15710 [Pirellulales bacterium]|jgi:hypothetical protein